MKANSLFKTIGASQFLLVLTLAATPDAGAQSYQYSRVGPEGTRRSLPVDINNDGTIVGIMRPPAPHPNFTFVKPADGDFVPFAVPGFLLVSLSGINNQGIVTGSLVDQDLNAVGFFANSDATGVRTLPFIDGAIPSPVAITENGQVVANIVSFDPAGNTLQRGVIIDTRHGDAVNYVDHSDPANPFTTLVGGNNRGFVLGYARSADYSENTYFTATRGDFASFQFPPGEMVGDVSDVNNRSQVLAFYIDPQNGKFHPFIRSLNGKVIELDYPDLAALLAQETPATMVRGGITHYRADSATMLFPTGMNDRGDVVGVVGAGYSDLQNPFPLDPNSPRMFWHFSASRGFLAKKN